MPTNMSEVSHRICPWPDCGPAGEENPCPAGMPALANEGYDVQPDPAAPPSTEKLQMMVITAGHMNQYDIMFSFGNAMSGAPIMSGIVKLPNAPASIGITTKKIMTVACIVKSMV